MIIISDAIKRNKIRITGIPEEEERERGTEDMVEQIIAENLPNLGKKTGIHIQEIERTPPIVNKNS